MFTKIGSFLGTLAFVALTLSVGHAAYESSQYVPPPEAPTLQQEIASTVAITFADGYCSGWVLKGSHTVVTAAHCNEGGDNTQVFNVDFGDGKQHPFHIEKLGDNNFVQGPDLMTLTTSDATVPWPAGLAVCTFKPYHGETINLIGGPLGYSWTTSFGKVSYPDRNLDDDVQGPYGHFIQYDGALVPGNSGGPAIDVETGCVMGVGEMSTVKEINDIPFLLNWLTPASELADLK
jgi:S1-C subfamily serine protease